MRIVDYLKNFINKLKNKKQNQLLLDSPKNLYTKLIKRSEINNIINNMPKNLSQMEKAYYIYLELGKIVSESPQFVFTDRKGKEKYYNDEIDEEYYGICKSISELYISILKDERIKISADSVKKSIESPITHVDTILKIDGKNYITNLISDLSRIKTSRRVNSFCFDLNRPVKDPILKEENASYLKILEHYYGKIDSLTREDIEKLDNKKNIYYIYSTKDKKYIYQTSEEMKQFIDSIDRNSLHIIGTFDRFNPKQTDELEL